MISEYVAHIRGMQPHGPYHLLGWSFGGALAHAIALRLQVQGESVALLAMLDSGSLDRQRPASLLPSRDEILNLILGVMGTNPAGSDQRLEFSEAVSILGAGGTLPGLLGELDQRHMRALFETYEHDATLRIDASRVRLRGSLLYFRATQGRVEYSPDYTEWNPHITGHVEVCDIACTHEQMTQPIPLADICRILNKHLDR
jgi:enterobactin synthetase component F